MKTQSGHPVTIHWKTIIVYGGFIILFLSVMVPVYWMVRSSLATPRDLITLPLIHFPSPTLRSFETLFTQVPLLQYIRNSLVFAISTALVSLLVSFLAGYAFARTNFRGSSIILWVLMLSMALPEVGTIVPLYQILRTFGLLDTIAGLTLVLSSTLTPFTVWVLISFIKQVPYEVEEAAIIDGASLFRIFWHILLPVTLPGLVTMGLINFINAWNNLLFPLAFTTSPTSKTLSVSITEVFAGFSPFGRPWELIMAVGVVMTVPIVILVFLAQKSIIRGLTAGAIK
ncbi:MAG TPA: carbohydrate ABC transporter permease [Levilinea sp.]|nr:carbohydrate ABC transporter permease [Levilinea sp.]